MARLKFSKTKEIHNDHRKYRPWLKLNQYPEFCGYSWLIDQSSLEADHYKPREHYPELKANPDNLILCTSFCNSSKNDYHPEAEQRRVYKNDTCYIFNFRAEDVGKSVKIKPDGSLTYRMRTAQRRFLFNEKIFNLNDPFFKETRKEYLDMLDTFKSMCEDLYIAKEEDNKEFMRKMEREFDTIKKACSKRLIFYKLLNVKIPKEIEKLLVNRTQVKFVS